MCYNTKCLVGLQEDSKGIGMRDSKAHVPKKHFGQNFLHDVSVLDTIVQSIPHAHDCRIVEVGAGLGDLTNRVLDCGRILAFEIDRDLQAHLSQKFDRELQKGSLEFVFGDVLEFWQGENLLDSAYMLVSNLPYYIATAIVVRALHDCLCKAMVVMVQKEVAQKFCAVSGNSALSVLAQSVGECMWVCDVSASAFRPAPKVDSAVFKIVRKSEIPPRLENLLQAAFAAPRKTLHNNLAKSYSKNLIAHAFETLGLAANVRPHELNTPQYHQLHRILEKGETNGE